MGYENRENTSKEEENENEEKNEDLEGKTPLMAHIASTFGEDAILDKNGIELKRQALIARIRKLAKEKNKKLSEFFV